jgi:hypothetical protein
MLQSFERLDVEQLQRTAGDEGFGYLGTEIGRGGADRGAVNDVGYLFAVGRDDHRVEVVGVVGGVAVGAKGELAASADGVEDGAFGLGCVFGGGAVEGADGGVDGGVANVSFVPGASKKQVLRLRLRMTIVMQ